MKKAILSFLTLMLIALSLGKADKNEFCSLKEAPAIREDSEYSKVCADEADISGIKGRNLLPPHVMEASTGRVRFADGKSLKVHRGIYNIRYQA